MNVGIITIQNALNYGSTLQAFALQECIKSLGHNPEIIDYQNEKINEIYRKNYSIFPALKKILIGHVRTGLIELKELMKHKHTDMYRRMLRQYDKYRFSHLKLTKKVFNENDKVFSEFDVLISGSDQVWNSSIVGNNPVYYLDIPSYEKKRVTYAASGNLLSCQARIDSIKKIDSLSVRESELKDELSDLGLMNVSVICDPTILCDRTFWDDQLINEPLDYEYIFAYLMWDEPLVQDFLEKLSKEKKLPVICIHRAATYVIVNEKKVNTASPQSFIDLLANAKYVIVNSFHGLAMSLIYEKQFMAYSSGRRIDNCLKKYELFSRSISKTTEIASIDSPINWKRVRTVMIDERKKGIKYLENALAN